jgi:hypothetical protein
MRNTTPPKLHEMARNTRAFAIGAACVLGATTALAQEAKSPSAQECPALMAALNPRLAKRDPGALLNAATLHEAGRCVAKDDTKALEYLNASASAGNRVAIERLTRRFARGWGVPQSYAMAGAWAGGKGASDERLDATDHSIGFAASVVTELLAAVTYPPLPERAARELSFVVEIDATRPTRLAYRMTSPSTPESAAISSTVQSALEARLPEVLKWLPLADASLLRSARVAVPVTLRYTSAFEVEAVRHEMLIKQP